MVKDLSTLLRESAAHPPADGGSDLAEVVRLGRARVRRRHTVALTTGAAALAVAGSLAAVAIGTDAGRGVDPARQQIEPVGPVVSPADAVAGVPGRDWSSVTSYTNDNLDRANGQYLSGLTPDGQVLVKDGPHGIRNTVRWGLMDPETGETTWLGQPSADLETPVALEEHRFVFTGFHQRQPVAVIYDRDSGGWSVPMAINGEEWGVMDAAVGSDNRLYYTVEGDSGTHADLWSTSLDSPDGDTRPEVPGIGDFAIDGDHLIWTDVTNAPNDRIQVRDLTDGSVHAFDPLSGDRCNQLSLQAAGGHIVMGQYCGTTNGGESPVRDDRVQVVDLDGSPVITVRGHGVEAGSVSPGGFVVTAYGSIDDRDGEIYVWSYEKEKLLRVADSYAKFSMPWTTGNDGLMWTAAVNDNHGARQWVATLP